MAEISPETSAASKAYDYAHYSGDSAYSNALRQQVVEAMQTGHDMPGFDDGFNQRLVDNGTLPDLMLKEWDNLDTSHDGTIDYNEIITAGESSDPLLRYLGEQINYNTIPGLRVAPEGYSENYATPVAYDKVKQAALDTPEQRPGDGAPVAAPGEIPPPAAPVLPADAAVALSDLQNPLSTPEQKLKDIEALVKAGQTTATIKDAEGNSITVRLELAPIAPGSTKNFVHMFAVDPATGKETVMMRAISDGTTISQQRDAQGNEVGFFGKKWMAQHPASMFKS